MSGVSWIPELSTKLDEEPIFGTFGTLETLGTGETSLCGELTSGRS